MSDAIPVERPEDDLVIPIVEERPVVSKEEVTTGLVRVSTHTEQRVVHVDDTIRKTVVDVQRVPINQFVEVEPQSREEDGVLVVPVVEEVVVKRMFLKEELRITRTSTLEPVERDVTLRVMHADVQRS